MYLAIDPGDVSGWCKFDAQGGFLKFGQIGQEGFDHWADNEIKHPSLEDRLHVIVEDYKIMGHKAQSHAWSRVPTLQKIGTLTHLCKMRNIPIHFQRNTCKTQGYKWGGVNPTGMPKAISHQWDAFAHGVYFLINKKIVSPTKFLPDLKGVNNG
jgi:hypothetical protein